MVIVFTVAGPLAPVVLVTPTPIPIANMLATAPIPVLVANPETMIVPLLVTLEASDPVLEIRMPATVWPVPVTGVEVLPKVTLMMPELVTALLTALPVIRMPAAKETAPATLIRPSLKIVPPTGSTLVVGAEIAMPVSVAVIMPRLMISPPTLPSSLTFMPKLLLGPTVPELVMVMLPVTVPPLIQMKSVAVAMDTVVTMPVIVVPSALAVPAATPNKSAAADAPDRNLPNPVFLAELSSWNFVIARSFALQRSLQGEIERLIFT